MMHRRSKYLSVLLIFIFIFSIFSGAVNATNYNYSTYKITVNNHYRYVGFTPQKITIYSNFAMKDIPSNIFGSWVYSTLTLKIYVYYGGHWHFEDSKTYYNMPYGKTEFSVLAQSYAKHWYWWLNGGSRYYKFTINIDKDKDLIFHCGYPHKIYASLHGKMLLVKSGIQPSMYDFSVSGYSRKFSIHSTPYDTYKRYWGYSMSAQDYNALTSYEDQIEEQYGEYHPSVFEQYSENGNFIFIIMGVAITSALVFIFYNHKKKRGE